jgi:G:T-mismatch repair DNA endonuclease (very short patch repair protein)
MRVYWTKDEENELRYYYEELGLSISEFYEKFIFKYPHRTKTALEVKIGKLKLHHTKLQISNLKSRLNSGEKNGMYGRVGPNNGLNKENSQRMRESSIKISKTRLYMSLNNLLPDVSGDNNGMYGKEPWNKGKTKYTDSRLLGTSEKQSKNRIKYWGSLNQLEKDNIIGRLSLAANKAKKDTKIEIIIKEILEKLNINFTKNYRCNKYIFDFYLTDYNFVIECQGDYWHGNPIFFKELNDIQLNNIERDKKKLKYLKDNKIESLFLWENEIYKNKELLDNIILDIIKKK